MRSQDQIGQKAAKHMAKEESRIIQERDESGICVDCGDKLQNPALSSPTCTTCANVSAMRCSKKGCINEAVVTDKQAMLCEVHAVESAHEIYESYQKKRAELEERRQDLDVKSKKLMYDPREDNKDDIVNEDQEIVEVRELHAQAQLTEQKVELLQNRLENIQANVDAVFPEGFNPSI